MRYSISRFPRNVFAGTLLLASFLQQCGESATLHINDTRSRRRLIDMGSFLHKKLPRGTPCINDKGPYQRCGKLIAGSKFKITDISAYSELKSQRL